MTRRQREIRAPDVAKADGGMKSLVLLPTGREPSIPLSVWGDDVMDFSEKLFLDSESVHVLRYFFLARAAFCLHPSVK